MKIRPELDLKVIKKERSRDAAYLENSFNRANCPSADKLRTLGWQCRFDAAAGFTRVWRHLQEQEAQTTL